MMGVNREQQPKSWLVMGHFNVLLAKVWQEKEAVEYYSRGPA